MGRGSVFRNYDPDYVAPLTRLIRIHDKLAELAVEASDTDEGNVAHEVAKLLRIKIGELEQ